MEDCLITFKPTAMNIALITEGASELCIIKHIVSRYVGTNICLNAIQPEMNGSIQVGCGGWNEVLKSCEKEENIKNALVENDYVIIQIDTDMSGISPYSVNSYEGGSYCGHEELWKRVKERIIASIPGEVDMKKMIFAICINEIECWLLPIFYNDKKRCKTTNCVNLLNQELYKKKIHVITDKNDYKAQSTYSIILKEINKSKDIANCAQYNYGFKMLIEQLDKVKEECQTQKGNETKT